MPVTTLGPGGPVVSRIGLGLAALGRPAYINSGRQDDLPDRSVGGLRARSFLMLDAGYAAGIRYFDAARSYGKAEEFLGGWLAERGHADAVVGSKWGYRYTGGWRLDADRHEVKEHSLAMFRTQLAESRSRLAGRLALYQAHSVTLDSWFFDDRGLITALARLRAEGMIIGITTSGPRQADTIRRALSLTVDGQPLITTAQVTWNLLETSVGPAAAEAAAAGWSILVKEAVANGRLVPAAGPPEELTELDADSPEGVTELDAGPPEALTELAAAHGVTEDAIALAAALANPWASVVLSGAITQPQLQANLAALTVGPLPALDLAESPSTYWSARAARPWR
jgi:aryl-alcohol dehydrogenase-like predicted oxidoreductase